MSTEIEHTGTPEEEELERKRRELSSLESDLIRGELELLTVRAELMAFEDLYLRTVGILYAELDELEAQIAEAQARHRTDDSQAQEKAARARMNAQESSETAKMLGTLGKPRSTPTENLKKLFREVAKRMHPDLATDELDRARRQTLMADANRAYEEGNEAKLQSVLDNWTSSPDTVEGEGVGPELIRVIRKIAQVQQRLIEIEAEIQQLEASNLYQLKVKVDEAETQGRDLLKHMASQVEQEIANAKQRLVAVDLE